MTLRAEPEEMLAGMLYYARVEYGGLRADAARNGLLARGKEPSSMNPAYCANG